jgi:hypothetical protein
VRWSGGPGAGLYRRGPSDCEARPPRKRKTPHPRHAPIAVVIPAFNAGSTLAACPQSILGQSLRYPLPSDACRVIVPMASLPWTSNPAGVTAPAILGFSAKPPSRPTSGAHLTKPSCGPRRVS